MKKFKLVLISSLLFLFSFTTAKASIVSVPFVFDLNSSLKDFSEPLISGKTDKNTSVLVYLDGAYVNDAETVPSSKNDLFYFFLDKLPENGFHSLFLIARDQNGILSAPSNEFSFFVSHDLKKPLILKSVFSDSFYFFGESLNENFVDLYIDSKLFSSVFINKNSDNTFYFKGKNITAGSHSAYFIARDKLGRKSPETKEIEFKIEKTNNQPFVKQNVAPLETKKPSISTNAAHENNEDVVVVEGIDNISEIDNKTTIEKEKSQLDDILKEINRKNPEDIGAITENGQRQDDLKWNLIIFLAFLLAVIFWIAWVNKEIKEEDSDNEKDSKE